jgi:hypothetical protein
MTMETLKNCAEMHDAAGEGGGRNLPMARDGVSSGAARRGDSFAGTENLMEVMVERENMLLVSLLDSVLQFQRNS